MVQRAGRSTRLTVGLEAIEVDGEVCIVGKKPQDMSSAEFELAGHTRVPILSIIRRRCLDCCSGSDGEVRRCVAVDCVSWPYRMGTDPFRKKVEMSAEMVERKREAMAKARALRRK